MSDPKAIEADWLNREQAAEYITRRTGVPMSRTILASRVSSGDGPTYRIWRGRGLGRGGRGRFAVYRPADLDAWIETQIHEPVTRKTANGSV